MNENVAYLIGSLGICLTICITILIKSDDLPNVAMAVPMFLVMGIFAIWAITRGKVK